MAQGSVYCAFDHGVFQFGVDVDAERILSFCITMASWGKQERENINISVDSYLSYLGSTIQLLPVQLASATP